MQHFTRFSLIIFVLAGLFTNSVLAQVAISSTSPSPTPDGSAILDLQSPDKGVLVPRFALDDASTAAPVTNPHIGLLIYNSGGVEVDGFYFWDGSKWSEIINQARIFASEQFGELFEINLAASPTVVDLTSNALWYGWTSSEPGTLSPGMTADTANTFADKLAISKYGLYKIQLSMSFGGSQNQQITSSVFIANASGDTETRIKVLSKVSSAGDLISGSSIGVLELHPTDSLDLRFQSNNNGESMSIYSINLIVTKVGE